MVAICLSQSGASLLTLCQGDGPLYVLLGRASWIALPMLAAIAAARSSKWSLMSGCLSSVPCGPLDEPGLILVFPLLLRRRCRIQAPSQAGQLLVARAQRFAQALVLCSEALELAPHLQQEPNSTQPLHLCATEMIGDWNHSAHGSP